MADRGRYASTYSTVSVNAMMNDDKWARCLTKFVIGCNILFVAMGAMIMGMGFYILLDPEFKMWVKSLSMEHYYTGVYIFMAVGCLVMVQSFFGICGAFQRKGTMLIVFIVFLVICFILEIAGSIYMINNGIRSSHMGDWLQHRFLELISEYNTNEASARIMNIIQEYVGCCGAEGILDYIRWNKVIPNTCYDPITGNAWYIQGYGYVGCVAGFAGYLEKMTGWICGLALFLAFFQMFCIVATGCLVDIKKDFTKSSLNISGFKVKQ